MSFIFNDKLSELRNVKGISKKKLKSKEYHLRRKMGMCFKCTSTNHTQKKCREKPIENGGHKSICYPKAVKVSHGNKELSLQQTLVTSTGKYDEKQDNVLTHLNVGKLDNLLIDNLLKPLCPDLKINQIPKYLLMKIIQQLNDLKEKSHGSNVEEIGNQENIPDEMNPHDEIHNLPTSMIDFENTRTELDKYLPISYGIKVHQNDIPTIIDQNHFPTVSIQRVINPESTENLDSDLQPKKKMKKPTAKVQRHKKSTIGIKTNQINNFDIPINQMGLDHYHENKFDKTFCDILETDREVDSEKMSITIDEDYIPTVIDRVFVQENSVQKKKSIKRVGRPRKSGAGIKSAK